jgi:hypothetical protein
VTAFEQSLILKREGKAKMLPETIQKMASLDSSDLVVVVGKCLSDGRLTVADVDQLLKLRALRFREQGESPEQAWDRAFFQKVRDPLGRELMIKATSQPMNDGRDNPRGMTSMRPPEDLGDAADDAMELERMAQEILQTTSGVKSKSQAVEMAMQTEKGKAIRRRDRARPGVAVGE